MKITQVQLFEYHLQLKHPLALKKKTLNVRSGLVVRLGDLEGHSGWGEIAPLPGFGLGDLRGARRQLVSYWQRLVGREVPERLVWCEDKLLFSLDNMILLPSVRCSLEMAVLNLVADFRGCSPAFLLNERYRKSVAVNGLLIGPENVVVDRARRLCEQGYQTLKLKVGAHKLEDDIRRVVAVRRAIGNNVSLRIDANRAWSLDEAVEFARQTADCRIEYIEEPLMRSVRLEEFVRATGMAVALDESLLILEPEAMPLFEGLKAIILKPTLLGGFERALQWARQAARYQVQAVVSSAFESSLGIAALASLAACLPDESACGLDTIDWFAEDILTSPLPMSGGRFEISSLQNVQRQIDRTKLKELPLA